MPTKKGRGSRVEWVSLPHSCMGVLKRFAFYTPAGYGESGRRFPTLYLFRGHETEWLGRQDDRYGLVRLLDRAIASGLTPPLVVVMPGFMDPARQFQGVPVNWSADGRDLGVGNGRFYDHFIEVKEWVETNLAVRTTPGSTALDGFSMGGYSAVMLAARRPECFGSVGAYDGSFMWPDQIDPRSGSRGRADKLWFSSSCRPIFARDGSRDVAKMERYNPITLIGHARGRRLAALKKIRFHLRAAGTERVGNVDRLRALLAVMRAKGITNSYRGEQRRLAPTARHDWRWADRHLFGTLERHGEVFMLDQLTDGA